MAWQHFTDWLPSGAQITLEQRNELFAAWRERVEATGIASIASADAAAYEAHPLITTRYGNLQNDPGDWLQYSGTAIPIDGADQWSEILTQLPLVASLYASSTATGARYAYRTYNNVGAPATGNILYAAAADLGYTLAEFQTMFPTGQFAAFGPGRVADLAAVWNILRRAIQRMEWVAPAEAAGTRKTWTKSGSGFTWSDRKSSFASASEGAASASNLLLADLRNSNNLTGFRTQFEAHIPGMAIFASYDVCSRIYGSGNRAVTLVLAWGAESAEVLSTALSPVIEILAVADPGPVTCNFYPRAYYDSSYLDELEPIDAPPAFKSGQGLMGSSSLGGWPCGIFLRPAWTHP